MMSTRDVSVSTGGEERVGRHIGRQGMRGKGGQPAPQKFGSLVAVSALVVVGGAILWLVKLRMFQDKMRTV